MTKPARQATPRVVTLTLRDGSTQDLPAHYFDCHGVTLAVHRMGRIDWSVTDPVTGLSASASGSPSRKVAIDACRDRVARIAARNGCTVPQLFEQTRAAGGAK